MHAALTTVYTHRPPYQTRWWPPGLFSPGSDESCPDAVGKTTRPRHDNTNLASSALDIMCQQPSNIQSASNDHLPVTNPVKNPLQFVEVRQQDHEWGFQVGGFGDEGKTTYTDYGLPVRTTY